MLTGRSQSQRTQVTPTATTSPSMPAATSNNMSRKPLLSGLVAHGASSSLKPNNPVIKTSSSTNTRDFFSRVSAATQGNAYTSMLTKQLRYPQQAGSVPLIGGYQTSNGTIPPHQYTQGNAEQSSSLGQQLCEQSLIQKQPASNLLLPFSHSFASTALKGANQPAAALGPPAAAQQSHNLKKISGNATDSSNSPIYTISLFEQQQRFSDASNNMNSIPSYFPLYHNTQQSQHQATVVATSAKSTIPSRTAAGVQGSFNESKHQQQKQQLPSTKKGSFAGQIVRTISPHLGRTESEAKFPQQQQTKQNSGKSHTETSCQKAAAAVTSTTAAATTAAALPRKAINKADEYFPSKSGDSSKSYPSSAHPPPQSAAAASITSQPSPSPPQQVRPHHFSDFTASKPSSNNITSSGNYSPSHLVPFDKKPSPSTKNHHQVQPQLLQHYGIQTQQQTPPNHHLHLPIDQDQKRRKLSAFSNHLNLAKQSFEQLQQDVTAFNEQSIEEYHSNLQFIEQVERTIASTLESIASDTKRRLMSSFNDNLSKFKSRSFQIAQVLHYLHSTEKDLQSNLDQIIEDLDTASLDDIITEYSAMIATYNTTRDEEILREVFESLFISNNSNQHTAIIDFAERLRSILAQLLATQANHITLADRCGHTNQHPFVSSMTIAAATEKQKSVYVSFENRDGFQNNSGNGPNYHSNVLQQHTYPHHHQQQQPSSSSPRTSSSSSERASIAHGNTATSATATTANITTPQQYAYYLRTLSSLEVKRNAEIQPPQSPQFRAISAQGQLVNAAGSRISGGRIANDEPLSDLQGFSSLLLKDQALRYSQEVPAVFSNRVNEKESLQQTTSSSSTAAVVYSNQTSSQASRTDTQTETRKKQLSSGANTIVLMTDSEEERLQLKVATTAKRSRALQTSQSSNDAFSTASQLHRNAHEGYPSSGEHNFSSSSSSAAAATAQSHLEHHLNTTTSQFKSSFRSKQSYNDLINRIQLSQSHTDKLCTDVLTNSAAGQNFKFSLSEDLPQANQNAFRNSAHFSLQLTNSSTKQ